MLSIPGPILTLIDEGRFSLRWMIRFDLDTGPTGIWSDTYPITFESVTYAPLAGNLEFDAIPGAAGLSSDRVQITVTNLLPAVTTIFAEEQWAQRPCTLLLAIMDDAGNAQHVIPRFSGFLDEVEISDAADDLVRVTMTIESNNRELNRSSGRFRSDADQRRVLITDGFFKHVTTANSDTNIYWGRKGPQQPKKQGFFGNVLSKIF